MTSTSLNIFIILSVYTFLIKVFLKEYRHAKNLYCSLLKVLVKCQPGINKEDPKNEDDPKNYLIKY